MVNESPSVNTLHIFRGLPGSGKSTAAAKLAKTLDIDYWETDMWMYEFEDQDYYWTPERLSTAIDKCNATVEYCMVEGFKDIIVTGVFSTYRSMREYIEMAAHYGYQVRCTTMTGNFGNLHSVPVEDLKKMEARFVPVKLLPAFGHVIHSMDTDNAF